MPKFKQNAINLLEPIGQPSDTWTTVYNWVFKIGRYIMLAIEIIVLVVFFSRFILDKQNNDLTESINSKIVILGNPQYRSDEQKFRNLQYLFNDVSIISNKQDIGSERISAIISGVPSSLTLDKFSYDTDRVSMSVLGPDLEAIKNYEFSMRQNPAYTNIIFSITKSGAGTTLYDVSITFNLGEVAK